MTCREWLAQHDHYHESCACIDEAIARIEAKGRKSRRNWWDTLAGGPGGRPSVREGITFPVLEVAQMRQGRPVTRNAVRRKPGELPPPDVVATRRWPRKKRAVARAKPLTSKKASGSHHAQAS